MISSLPSDIVSLICSFCDTNTFHSFTLTNSSYNQNQTLYYGHIIKNYSSGLFGFPAWNDTVFENKGFLPNGKLSGENVSFSVREALLWRDLFYRINSKKYLKVCGNNKKFPVYFNETLINVIQRVKKRCSESERVGFSISNPKEGYFLTVLNSLKPACCSYRCNTPLIGNEVSPIMDSVVAHKMSSVLGSLINNGTYLFDSLSVIAIQSYQRSQ
jgi:hypothetical protein